MRGCYPGAAAVLCLALTTRLGVGVPADGILPNSAPPRRPPDANRIIPAVEPPLPPPPWHRTEGGLPEWDPQSISMATSAGVVAMARKARTAPTHEDVYELALRLTPYDQALHVGPQRFSIHGHRMTIDRIHESRARIAELEAEEDELAQKMLRYRSRFKKWGTRMLPDFVFEELRRSNLTALQLGREPVHPTGYPTHRDSDEVAVLHGLQRALEANGSEPSVVLAAAVATAWATALHPLNATEANDDEYAPIVEQVEEADALFRRALALEPGNAEAHVQHGKFRELFVGDVPGAEAAYRQALAIDRNCLSALAFLAYLLRYVKDDPGGGPHARWPAGLARERWVPDGKMPGFSRNLGGWDGAVTGRGVEGGAYDREAQAARAALDAAEYLGAGGVPEEWRLLQGRKDVLLDRRRIFARNSDRYFDPALDEGDLRPYWNALARGTVEGPSGATPLDLLAVPPPTAAELRAVGFPPGEAEAQAGGRELLWEESHGYRFWHAHHWYRQHFRNGNVTRAQTRLARAEGARVLQACGLRGAPLCEVCEESPAWELFRNSIWGSGRWSYGRWGGGRGGSAEQAPPPAAAAAAAGLRGGGFDYSRFDALDVSSDSPPSDGARAPPTACATDAELTRGAAGDMDALRSDPASADPDRMIGTLQAIQNMHSKAQSSFEDWQELLEKAAKRKACDEEKGGGEALNSTAPANSTREGCSGCASGNETEVDQAE